MSTLEFDNHESLYYFNDKDTALKTIVSTVLGPATGATHSRDYENDIDALRR